MPGTKPDLRSRRTERDPCSGRSSTVSSGRFVAAMTVGQCSEGLKYPGAGMARKDEGIPGGRVQRTAKVGQALGSAGPRYAGTRARNVVRSDEAAAVEL